MYSADPGVASGASVAVADVDGWHPLHFACYYSQPNIVDLLLRPLALLLGLRAATRAGVQVLALDTVKLADALIEHLEEAGDDR